MSKLYDLLREWESMPFPIEISNLSFEKNLHDLSEGCTIKIWRDEDFKLQATIEGYIENAKSLSNPGKEEGYGNFAVEDIITGYVKGDGKKYSLSGCIIGSYNLQGVTYPGYGMPFSAELHLSSITYEPEMKDSEETQVEQNWYISSSTRILYPGGTKRFDDNGLQRLRSGVDPERDTSDIVPISMSRDFFKIEVPGAQCIVSIVPKEIGLSWASCFCIEYRSAWGPFPKKEVKEAIEDLISFLYGAQFIYVGTTKFSENEIVEQRAVSPSVINVKHKCQNGTRPPIQFNNQFDWGKIECLINTLLPVYLEKMDSLNLSGILWRYFQAIDIAIGVNLPALSSALEKLANNYLKAGNVNYATYMDGEQFSDLIGDELKIIEEKFSSLPYKDVMIRKMKSAYQRGSNEKMDFFFSLLELQRSKVEKKALQKRNSMAHGGSDAESMAEVKKLILHTRAYETLFHRVFLRILGYTGYYIDYYHDGSVSKHIDSPSGPIMTEHKCLYYKKR